MHSQGHYIERHQELAGLGVWTPVLFFCTKHESIAMQDVPRALSMLRHVLAMIVIVVTVGSILLQSLGDKSRAIVQGLSLWLCVAQPCANVLSLWIDTQRKLCGENLISPNGTALKMASGAA
jgi:hypothetical protein